MKTVIVSLYICIFLVQVISTSNSIGYRKLVDTDSPEETDPNQETEHEDEDEDHQDENLMPQMKAAEALIEQISELIKESRDRGLTMRAAKILLALQHFVQEFLMKGQGRKSLIVDTMRFLSTIPERLRMLITDPVATTMRPPPRPQVVMLNQGMLPSMRRMLPPFPMEHGSNFNPPSNEVRRGIGGNIIRNSLDSLTNGLYRVANHFDGGPYYRPPLQPWGFPGYQPPPYHFNNYYK